MTDSTDIRNKKNWILLGLIFSLGAFLRFYGLTDQSLWFDEVLTVRTAEREFAGIITDLSVGWNCSPPLYYFMLHLWMKVFGTGELAVRMLPALWGLLLIPAIFYVGSSLFNRNVGLISAYIVAIGEFHIRYSQEARMYTMLALLGLLSMYFLYKALTTDRKLSWVGYILFTILIIYTHNYGMFITSSGVVFAFICFVTQKKVYRNFFISLSVIAIGYIPCLLIFHMNQYGTSSLLGWLPSMRLFHVFNTFLAFSGLSLGSFALNHVPIIAIGVIIFLYFFLTGIFSIKPYKKIFIPYVEANMNLILLLCYLLVTLAIPMLISIKQPIFMPDRHSISAWPAFALILGLGLSKIRGKYILVLSLILITLISSVSWYWYYFVSVKSCDKKIARFVDSRARENDVIVFAPGWFDLPVNFYLQTSLKQIGFPERSSKELVVDSEPAERKPDDMIPIIESRMGNFRGTVFIVCRIDDTNLDVQAVKSLYYNKSSKQASDTQMMKNLFDRKLKKIEEVTYERDYDSINVTVYHTGVR